MGSLKPMCPFAPMAEDLQVDRTGRADLLLYASQAATTSSAVPSGTCTMGRGESERFHPSRRITDR